MATENYPTVLPLPLVNGGFEQSVNPPQRVGLFDVEVLSTDEVNQFNVSFTFTDLQYKGFHGWFMNDLIEGQKWFNIELNGDMYECTFGGNQPSYNITGKIHNVSASMTSRVFA